MDRKISIVNKSKKGKNHNSSFFLFPSSFVKARRAFTLIEMLVVIGILAILVGIGMNTFSGSTRRAQQARAQALVGDVSTALEAILQREGSFPRRILDVGESGGAMDEKMAYELARRKVMSLTYDDSSKKTIGIDRCGVVSPWAQDVIKRNGSAGSSTAVPSGGTIQDHVVRFAVDVDGDGYIELSGKGGSSRIRASAIAWCCGPDGEDALKFEYSKGRLNGCSYSWGRDQQKKEGSK